MKKHSHIVVFTLAVLMTSTGVAHAAPQSTGDAEAAKAISLYTSALGDITTMPNGVHITNSGHGSSFHAAPSAELVDHQSVFYGLTDRGPNVDGDLAGKEVKVEPVVDFQPNITKFVLRNGVMEPRETIGLKRNGKPINGQLNGQADTGETIVDITGRKLAPSDNGLDPEGLVAAKDGSFFVSDEYGPFIVHFDADGNEIDRLNPYEGTLPAELRFRTANKGMEGLTLSPDGKTLYGVMQSALTTPDIKGKSKNVPFVRIVAIDTASMKVTGQYLYMLHSSQAHTTVSEISALGNHTLLVDERDGKAGSDTFKRLYRIDLAQATNLLDLANAYGSDKGGVLIDGKSLEGYVSHTDGAKANEQVAAETLRAAGISPAQGRLYLDVTKLVWGADPSGNTFSHDKVEGVAVTKGGQHLTLANDSDFGLEGSSHTGTQFELRQKEYQGRPETGEALDIDMTAVPQQYRGDGYIAPEVNTTDAGTEVEVTLGGLQPDTGYELLAGRKKLVSVDADARGDTTAAVDRAELTAAGSTLTLALGNQVVGSWSVQPAATPSPSMSPSAPAASPTATASGSSPITSPTSSTRATPAATPTGVPSAIVTPEPSSHKEATPAGSTTGHDHGTDDDSSTSSGSQIVTSSPSRDLALPATGN